MESSKQVVIEIEKEKESKNEKNTTVIIESDFIKNLVSSINAIGELPEGSNKISGMIQDLIAELAKLSKEQLNNYQQNKSKKDCTSIAEIAIKEYLSAIGDKKKSTKNLLMFLEQLLSLKEFDINAKNPVHSVGLESEFGLLHMVVFERITDDRNLNYIQNLLELFYKKNADFNILNSLNETAMHIVIYRYSQSIARAKCLLLDLEKFGCGINRYNKHNFTVFDLLTNKEKCYDTNNSQLAEFVETRSGYGQKMINTSVHISTLTTYKSSHDKAMLSYKRLSVMRSFSSGSPFSYFQQPLSNTFCQKVNLNYLTTKDEFDQTYAHYAIHHASVGYLSSMAELCQYGLSLISKNKNGWSAIDCLAVQPIEKIQYIMSINNIAAAVKSQGTHEQIKKILGLLEQHKSESEQKNESGYSQTNQDSTSVISLTKITVSETSTSEEKENKNDKAQEWKKIMLSILSNTTVPTLISQGRFNLQIKHSICSPENLQDIYSLCNKEMKKKCIELSKEYLKKGVFLKGKENVKTTLEEMVKKEVNQDTVSLSLTSK